MRLLSAGDVVTVGLKIYQSHFKLYFRLAFISHIWLIIPLYGWAKFLAESALISRLAFSELIGQPETPKEARKTVNKNFWQYLLTAILVVIIVSIASLILFIADLLILYQISVNVININAIANNRVLGLLVAVFILLSMLGVVFLFFALCTLVYSRFFLAELPLAMEENMQAWTAIKRSCGLTKGSVMRLQLILTIAFLISLPFQVISQTLIQFFEFLPKDFLNRYSSLDLVVLLIILWVTNAFVMPFWQSIKAALYYDLRNRKEGLSLQVKKMRSL
jgi:hypothetical protein